MKENLPEIVFASSVKAESQRISRLVKAGRLRKISPRVYTSNLADEPDAIVVRNLYQILGRLFSGAVLSHRTALEAKPTEDGAVFLTYKYSRKIRLPGITVHLLKGKGRMEDDMPFLDGLFISSRPRAYLENLQVSRSRSSSAKTLPRSAVEDGLDRLCQVQGETALNTLRDKARVIAPVLGMETQFQVLNKIIAAILRSRSAKELDSKSARARSLGVPYDTARLAILNSLFSHLLQSPQPARVDKNRTSDEIRLLAFFESYFSNYIEGTEFEIDEAYDIVFKNRIPLRRPEDAHDIMGTFRIVSNHRDMRRTPASFDEFLDLLQSRHHAIMEGRPDKLPGQFKSEPNRAGQTHFVAPELVRGTLLKGFDLQHVLAERTSSAARFGSTNLASASRTRFCRPDHNSSSQWLVLVPVYSFAEQPRCFDAMFLRLGQMISMERQMIPMDNWDATQNIFNPTNTNFPSLARKRL